MDTHNPNLIRVNSQTTETSKKRKSQRKKAEPKPAKQPVENIETFVPEISQDVNSDILNYTYTLEYKLTEAKRKLKLQRKKFQSVVQNLSLYLENKGVTPEEMDEYTKGISAQLIQNKAQEAVVNPSAPYKKVHLDEPIRTDYLEAAEEVVKEPIETKEKTKKRANPSNAVKANNVEATESQPTPTKSSKATGSASKKEKEKEKDKVTTIILDSPTSPKQKKRQRKPKGDSASKKKEVEPPQQLEPAASDDVKEIPSQIPFKPQQLQQHLSEEFVKNLAVQMPGAVFQNLDIQNVMKQFSADQMNVALGMGASAFMGKEDNPYNFSNFLNGLNSADLERLYSGFVPTRNFNTPNNANNAKKG